jgi:predicted fused transcriptional regulator/phosphomethylpyrimidine kinase/predicted transcriptional regulator
MVEEVVFCNSEDTKLLKIAVARILHSKDFSQKRISEILKISQPMVSNYCISNEKIPDNIKNLSELILSKIFNKYFIEFNICISFEKKIPEGLKYVAEKNEIINHKNEEIFDNLTESFLLLKGKNIDKLIPAVKINIAMAKDNAESIEDVASFLNGLIIADDKVISNNGIRFGKSKHLSTLLINLKESVDAKAIMNIAYVKNIKKTNFKFNCLTDDYKLNTRKNNVDILLHKGDFGIEPCAYIIGNDAVDVVNKFLRLMEELD